MPFPRGGLWLHSSPLGPGDNAQYYFLPPSRSRGQAEQLHAAPPESGQHLSLCGLQHFKEAKWPVGTQGPLSSPLWEDTAVLDRVPGL